MTSPSELYQRVLPLIRRSSGGRRDGAGVLGVHLEGPFISRAKPGAHPPAYIRGLDAGFATLAEMYGGGLDNVAIVTLAPELDADGEVVRECVRRGIAVSVGHSIATLTQVF